MPAPFARTASQTRPTFSRDFAGLKTLDHGAGPAITFTRASNATFFNASGVLQTASNDQPRFDHDPATGASRGLLIEESRTNSIRNSQAGGSTNGVIGSGGALPTNWNASGHTTNGVSTEIIGTGTESGLAYVDIKISGTPTATASAFFNTENASHIVAADGQTWTSAAYIKLAGGSVSNATLSLNCSGRDSGGSGVSGQTTSQSFIPTSSALAGQRISATRTFSSASVVRVLQFFQINYTSGNPIDLTLRIAAPQLEQGALPTSYIPTTSAAATRSADSAVVTPISSFYNQSEGTLFAEAVVLPRNANIASISINNAETDRLTLYTALAGTMRWFINSNNVIEYNSESAAITSGAIGRIAGAYRVNDVIAATNGILSASDTSIPLPPVSLTHFFIGRTATTFPPLNGHIRKIAYYPRRLSNTLLQQLTT